MEMTNQEAIETIEANYPPENYSMLREALDMTLAMLKEREPVEPKLVDVNTWVCGKCGELISWEEFSQFGLELVKYKYCPECGKAVKWEYD